MRTFLLAALIALVAGAGPADAKMRCGQASKCPAGVVADIRSAVDTACPCSGAASPAGYKKCSKPVVKGFTKSLGKTGFPKACRKEVGHVLTDSICGRSGFVLCRKTTRRGAACAVAKASKCADVFPTGRGFPSCADACQGSAALPFPSTFELAPGDLASLQPDPGDGTLRFDSAPQALANVVVGNVIVAGIAPSTPKGLLRAVLAVQRDDQGGLTLRTGAAPIQLAYRKLHVQTTRSTALVPSAAATSSIAPRVDFGTKKDFDYILFDGDSDKETKNDQVAIDGEVGGGFDYDFTLDVDWGDVANLADALGDCLASLGNLIAIPPGPPSCSIEDFLPEAKVTFTVHPQVSADVNVHGAALLGYEKEIPLAAQDLPPIPIGPLVFVPNAEIKAKLEGGASGEFSAGVHGSAVFRTAVTVSSKHTSTPDFQEPELVSQDFGPNDTKASLTAFARVGLAATLSFLVFDTAGPYATAEPYVAINANVLEEPCWNLHGGIQAGLGIKVTVPDLLPVVGDVTLVDWTAPTVNPLDLSIANGQCQPPPDFANDPRPPGSGPDATHLAMPTYTPWSRTYDSPVDGAQAASPGNSVNFSELQRTIDGRYVRSGFGVQTLTKFDDVGTLTWARALALDDGTPLAPLRVRSTTDATLFVVSSAPGIAPIVLTKVAQDGNVVEAHSYDVPAELCEVDVTALASDGAGGAWVVGRCTGAPRSFLLHATGSASTLRLIGDIDALRINVVERHGDGVFLAGSGSEGVDDRLFAFRIAADGTVVYAKRYEGCVLAPDAIPSTAIVGSQGEVTLAGSGGAQHNGLILRVLADGNVGFASFPGYGFGVGDVLVFDSLVELPTTGYVAGGSSVQVSASAPENVPSATLAGLDAAGTVIWANRYTFGDTGTFANSGHVAVRLSDDGGVVATALLANALDPFTGGRLWAFKPFARDGSITFAPGAVTVTPLTPGGIVNLPCSMTASDHPLTGDTQTISGRAVTVTSTPVSLAVEQ